MFFELQDAGNRAYRYAVSDRNFGGYINHICPKCSRRISRSIYNGSNHELKIEGGLQYPDVLPFCGAGTTERGGRPVIFSEKAINAFVGEGISGVTHFQKVYLFPAENARYNATNAPTYYWTDVVGTIDLDFSAMSNLRKKKFCGECGQFEWSHHRLIPLVLDEKTWDRSEMCLIQSLPGYVVCTERVKSVVQKYHLTNFAFSKL